MRRGMTVGVSLVLIATVKLAGPKVTINRDRARSLFLRLVLIDSGRENEGEICGIVSEILSQLGAERVTVDKASETLGGTGGNVLAFFKGSRDAPPLLLSAHLDTVSSTERIRIVETEDAIGTDGTTILGADDKAGVALILEAIHTIREQNLPSPPLEVLFTIREEKGLKGAKVFDTGQVRSRYGLVVDGSGSPGDLIVGSPYHCRFEVTFFGRAAHAGVEPEKGVNAIAIAADAVSRFPLGRLDRETTANVGLITGGVAMNVVPDRCTVVGEVRSHSEGKMHRVLNRLKKACQRSAGRWSDRLEWKQEITFAGLTLSRKEPIVVAAATAVRQLGFKPRLVRIGGGTDANVLVTKGIRCLVLPTGGKNYHSTEEQLILKDFYQCGDILAATIVQWAGGGI